MVPVGIRSGPRGTEPGDPVAVVPAPPTDAGRLPVPEEGGAAVGGVVVEGLGPGIGVRTGGARSTAGPGRGMGVSIGIGVMGPEAVGGSSLTGSFVSRGGVMGGD